MRARRLAGMVLVAVAACAPEAAPPEDAPGRVETPAADRQEPVAIQEIACEGLARTILAVEPDRRSLEARFGAPDSVVATTEPNRHVPDRVDSLFVVHYPGLTASLRKPEGREDMVDGAVVTGGRFLAYPAIGVGAPEERVIAALGEPTRRAPDTLVYDCGVHVEEPVTFRLRDGLVRRIEIDYYLD